MTCVLDANAGIEIILNRPKAVHFKAFINQCNKIISSDLYKAEVANTLWKYIIAGYLSKDKAADLLQLAQNLVDEYYEIDKNNSEALIESVRVKHSVYDMLYLTLARREGAILLSLDRKLLLLAKKNGIEIFERYV